jgi:hypothetical protein
MTTEAASITAAAGPARRARRRGRIGLPAGVSLALHGLLAAAAGVILWDVAWRSPRAGPEVSISFGEPGDGGGGEARAAPAATGVTPVALDAAEWAGAARDAPADAPVLTGLSTPAPADGRLPWLPATAGIESLGPAPIAAAAPTATEVRFAGLGASTARGVVYVIDASGPMVSSLPEVVREVVRSISRLGPSQRFGVVVFRKRVRGAPAEAGLTAPAADDQAGSAPVEDPPGDDRSFEWFTPSLVRATPEAKERVARWLSGVRPGGRSTPLDGLRAAIELGPDAIFLLSRGIERSGGGVWDLGLARTMAELDRLNPRDPETGRRPIVIKTIQFLDEDPTGIMQAIGRAHGGAGRAGAGGGAADSYTVIRRGADLGSR